VPLCKSVRLDPERHQPTGQTRHIGVPTEAFRELRIVERDHGIFLLYLDQDGNEVTDTWHQSLGDAMHQAEFEFSVQPDEWSDAD
jgi:hypothetical protein